MSVKTERIARIIEKNVSLILRNDVKDPNIGIVVITDVFVTNDLSLAKIYVDFLDTKNKVGTRMATLDKVKGLVKSKLAKMLEIKKCPNVEFVYDTTLQQANHIDELIEEVNKK